MKQLESDLDADERELLHHLGHMARAIEEGPADVIAWNRAITREQAEKAEAKALHPAGKKGKR